MHHALEWPPERLTRLASQTLRGSCLLLAALIAGLSLLLIARRLSGAFDQALSGPLLCSVTLFVVIGVSGWRCGVLVGYGAGLERVRRSLMLISTASVLLIASALTIPASPPWALAFLWLLVVATEISWWTSVVRRQVVRGEAEYTGAVATVDRQEPTAIRESATGVDLEADASMPFDEGVIQRLTRALDERGEESLHGILKEQFRVGERIRQAHVAICPPLADAPDVEIFQIDGPPVSIKVAQRETFGLRFEVRLMSRSETVEWVGLEFYAHAAARVEP